jgi:class I lanthipeptide synthase
MQHSTAHDHFGFADFFVLRCPLLPFERAITLFEASTSALARADKEGRVGNELRAVPISLVRTLLAETGVREAIALASPSLRTRLDSLDTTDDHKKRDRAIAAFVRYYLRAAGRPTPFGLFGCTSVGLRSRSSDLSIEPPHQSRPCVRLDHEVLGDLVAVIDGHPEIRKRLTYAPNSSLYHCGGQLRYVERSYDARGVCRYELAAVDSSQDLEAILVAAHEGMRYDKVLDILTESGLSSEDGEAFLEELIQAQILVSTLEPPLVCGDSFRHVMSELQSSIPSHPVTRTLEQIGAVLNSLSMSPIGRAENLYDAAATLVRSLPLRIEHDCLFDVQLPNLSSTITLGPSVYSELQNALDVLEACRDAHVDSDYRKGRDELDTFRQAFVRRYEYQSVPLAVALDDELGIGFKGGWNQRGEDQPEGHSKGPKWTARDSVLSRHLFDALGRGERELRFDDSDIVELRGTVPQPPHQVTHSFVTIARLAAHDSKAIDAGEYHLYVEACHGTHGGAIFGRFCAADPRLCELVRAELRAEEEAMPTRTVAEIAHLPQWRMANVISRPSLRTFELPYLGRAGATAANRLDLNDLYVSVVDDRIVLSSQRLGHEVVPSLTSAHAALEDNNVPVYRFLYALQIQREVPRLTWSWGALTSVPFLPRVTFGRTILALARWWLTKKDLAPLEGLAWSEYAASLRSRLGLPRHVAIVKGDNFLPVDITTRLGIDVLVSLARGYDEILVVELFPPADSLAVTDGVERYTHELLIPTRSLAAASRPQDAQPPPRPRLSPVLGPSYAPAREWLFAKLYTGPVTGDRILVQLVGPLVAGLKAAGHIDRWFFIRYADPLFHLRLRLHGRSQDLSRFVLPQISAHCGPWLDNGSLHTLQFDTYRPEVDRYGGTEAMPLVESLFHADSEAALALIESADDASEKTRILAALAGIDGLLGDAQMRLDQRRALMHELLASFGGAELPAAQAKLRRNAQSGEFRARRSAIVAVLSDKLGHDNSSRARIAAILRRRSIIFRPALASLVEMTAAGLLTTPVGRILASLVHMHVNRVMQQAPRTREQDLYYFLSQHYDSEFARARVAPGGSTLQSAEAVTPVRV